MAFRLGEAFVEIKADLDGFRGSLSGAHGLFSGALSRMGGLVSGVAGTLFSPLAAAFAAAAGGLAIGGGIAYAVSSAAALNETLSKTGVVFGRSAGEVIAAADAIAAGFGVPKKEYLDAAAGIGLIAKASGLTQAEAGKLSVSLAQLGVDATSFYDVPLEEALLTIKSALVGESEPIRKFGVLLNEAAVRAEALRLGLSKGSGELTEGMKVQARASLITKGMADASGDLARTQDSLSNRIRELQGRFTNLATDMGQYLVPALQTLAGAFSTAMADISRYVEENKGMFDGWSANMQEVADLVAAAIKNPAEGLGVLRAAFSDLFAWIVGNAGPTFDRMANAMIDAMAAGFAAVKGMATQGGVDWAAGFLKPTEGGFVADIWGWATSPESLGFGGDGDFSGGDGGEDWTRAPNRLPERPFVEMGAGGALADARKALDAAGLPEAAMDVARGVAAAAEDLLKRGNGLLARGRAEWEKRVGTAAPKAMGDDRLGFGVPREKTMLDLDKEMQAKLNALPKPEKEKGFKAEFISGSDINRSIQKAILEGGDSTPKKQLKAAEEANKLLGKVNETLAKNKPGLATYA